MENPIMDLGWPNQTDNHEPLIGGKLWEREGLFSSRQWAHCQHTFRRKHRGTSTRLWPKWRTDNWFQHADSGVKGYKEKDIIWNENATSTAIRSSQKTPPDFRLMCSTYIKTNLFVFKLINHKITINQRSQVNRCFQWCNDKALRNVEK